MPAKLDPVRDLAKKLLRDDEELTSEKAVAMARDMLAPTPVKVEPKVESVVEVEPEPVVEDDEPEPEPEPA